MQPAEMSRDLQQRRLTSITNDDRNGDGSLKPESRERILSELEDYIRDQGHTNISDISRQLGMARQHVRPLIAEIITTWKRETADLITIQIAWYEHLVFEVMNEPEKFTDEYVRMITLVSGLWNKINSLILLQRSPTLELKQIQKITNLPLWK